MEDVQSQLQTARERLAAFEEASSRDHLMERLRAVSPGHPLVLGRNLAAFSGMGLTLASVAVLAAPLWSRDIAKSIHDFDTTLGFPMVVALILIAGSFFAMSVALHQLALGSARNAPLLPTEAKQHQRLVADVKQLESKLALEGTPRPVVRVQR